MAGLCISASRWAGRWASCLAPYSRRGPARRFSSWCLQWTGTWSRGNRYLHRTLISEKDGWMTWPRAKSEVHIARPGYVPIMRWLQQGRCDVMLIDRGTSNEGIKRLTSWLRDMRVRSSDYGMSRQGWRCRCFGDKPLACNKSCAGRWDLSAGIERRQHVREALNNRRTLQHKDTAGRKFRAPTHKCVIKRGWLLGRVSPWKIGRVLRSPPPFLRPPMSAEWRNSRCCCCRTIMVVEGDREMEIGKPEAASDGARAPSKLTTKSSVEEWKTELKTEHRFECQHSVHQPPQKGKNREWWREDGLNDTTRGCRRSSGKICRGVVPNGRR